MDVRTVYINQTSPLYNNIIEDAKSLQSQDMDDKVFLQTCTRIKGVVDELITRIGAIQTESTSQRDQKVQELTKTQDEFNRLTRQVETIKNELNGFNAKAAELQSRKSSLETQMQQDIATLNDLQAQYDKNYRDLMWIHKHPYVLIWSLPVLAALEIAVAATKGSRDAAQSQLDNRRAGLNQTNSELSQNNDQINSLNGQINDSQNQLATQNNRRREVDSMINQIGKNLTNLQNVTMNLQNVFSNYKFVKLDINSIAADYNIKELRNEEVPAFLNEMNRIKNTDLYAF